MKGYFLCSKEVSCGNQNFLVNVYTSPHKRGKIIHTAEAMLEPGDSIVSDGYSIEEVLANVKNILPLAIHSRLLLHELQNS